MVIDDLNNINNNDTIELKCGTYQDAKIEGESQKIAFNYKYLIDFLNQASKKKIVIELLRSDAPVVFRIEGVSNFFHIIMPVRIQE